MNADSLLAMGTPPVLVTLFTGLLIAFAVQLLLTTFGIAAGITAIGYLPGVQSTDTKSDAAFEDEVEADAIEEDVETGGSGTAGKIGFAVGAGTLLTVNTVLFVASFLAVKLSLVNTLTLGATLGIVIWAGYFLVLTWLSSKAAGSVLGLLVGAVSSGVQGLMATVTAALGRNKKAKNPANALPAALDKRLAATESSLETLQTQLEANTRTVETTLQEYVQTLQPPKLDLEQIRREVTAIVAEAGLPSVAQKTALRGIDRPMLVDLVSRRTDFSRHDINQVVDQLEAVWRDVTGGHDTIADLTTFFQSANPDQLTPDDVKARLEQLHADAQPPTSSSEVTNLGSIASLEPKQLIKQLAQTVRDRVDLSDLDVGKILQQLQTFIPSSDATDMNRPVDPFSGTIESDVEAYLRNAYPWNLTRKTVKAEFKDVLYDPDANPTAVKHQLLPLNRDTFVALLEQRDDLTPNKIDKIVDRLEETRQEVLDNLEATIAEAPSKAFQAQVSEYLRTVKQSALKPAAFEKQLQTLLQQSERQVEHWSDRLQSLTHDRLTAALKARQDLSHTELDTLVAHLEAGRDRLLEEIQSRQAELAAEAKALWQKLGDYVSDRSQKLTARNMQRQLKALLKATQRDVDDLRQYLPSFDAESVKQWLSDRQDLSEKQQTRVLGQLEKTWNSLPQVPQQTIDAARSGYSQVLTILTDYLQHIDPTTFDVAALPQDLLHYVRNHHFSSEALGELTQLDWTALVDRVKQRPDLTAQQQQQLLEQVQQTIYTAGKLPRRFALRAKRQMHHWQDTLNDYLRYADREDLSIDRLPQLLQHFFQADSSNPADPSSSDHWVEALQQHLSSPDYNHWMTVLRERGDMTEAEISHLLEKLEAFLKHTIEQAKALQQQTQATIATTVDQLQHYIAALPLPDLDYDRLKDDLQQLLVDPQLGLENLSSSVGDTLREQLGRLNRHTLSTLLSTRDDLSETVVQKLVDRVESVRLGALDRIEAVQQEAQRRVETLKQQAQRQAEETRKAIATAAWWLFATAFSSALTAAIAGAIAVGGLEWLEHLVS
ncbi:MAG: hypothetical protein KME27_03835 [Lyngbya sp. HA4199-MV5]|jgi:hypothetical protein|nr:hypothetical protein [Lyngbya sp. HA4199-MV5]